MKKYFKKGILYFSIAIIFIVTSSNHIVKTQNKIQQGLHPCEKASKWQNLLCDNDILILDSMIIIVSFYALYLAIDFKLLFADVKNKLKKPM